MCRPITLAPQTTPATIVLPSTEPQSTHGRAFVKSVAVASFAIHAVFAAGAIRLLTGVFSIDWGRQLAFLKPALPFFDVDGDGRLTSKDVEAVFSSHVFPLLFPTGSVQHKVYGVVIRKLNVDAAENLLQDAKALTERNRHAAAGGAIGFALGLATGLGSGLPLLPLLPARGSRNSRGSHSPALELPLGPPSIIKQRQLPQVLPLVLGRPIVLQPLPLLRKVGRVSRAAVKGAVAAGIAEAQTE